MLETGTPVNGKIANKATRHGYVIYARSGTSIDVEVTHGGSSKGLDTLLAVHGPRTEGTYPEVVAADDDSGYGALSRVRDHVVEQDGFYLVDLSVDPSSPEISGKSYRIVLRCDGDCEAPGPVAPVGLDIRWAASSAEYIAASHQAFALASQRLDALAAADALPETWAISIDADETIISNVQYQRERAELGTGYSSASWTAWVARREATAMAGAASFLEHVQELGGLVAVVTNRKAIECADTEANLEALDLPYDMILCRTSTSDKNPRFASIVDGSASSSHPAAELVMFVGDNIQDFPDMTQAIRHEGSEAFEDFAESHIVLPNPMYGSWTENQ